MKRASRVLFLLGVGGTAAAMAQMPVLVTPELHGAVRALLYPGKRSEGAPVTPGPETPYLHAFGKPALRPAPVLPGPMELMP